MIGTLEHPGIQNYRRICDCVAGAEMGDQIHSNQILCSFDELNLGSAGLKGFYS